MTKYINDERVREIIDVKKIKNGSIEVYLTNLYRIDFFDIDMFFHDKHGKEIPYKDDDYKDVFYRLAELSPIGKYQFGIDPDTVLDWFDKDFIEKYNLTLYGIDLETGDKIEIKSDDALKISASSDT